MSTAVDRPTGRLYLVPNTLDLGTADVARPLDAVLPRGSLEVAARLTDWVAENAKAARALLKRVDAVVPLAQPLQAVSIVELPRPAKGRGSSPERPDLKPLLAPLLAGRDMGLVSDAGLPAVADPGSALVAAAQAAGVPVVALSGPSSLALAIAASGLEGQSFAFVGYVPSEPTARLTRLRELEALSRRAGQTQLMIEAPYRNAALLDALLAALQPQTRLSVSVGLTLSDGWTRSDRVAGWRRTPAVLPADVPAVFAILA